jgi:hypothetical protein
MREDQKRKGQLSKGQYERKVKCEKFKKTGLED